jgi:hypothetical protein
LNKKDTNLIKKEKNLNKKDTNLIKKGSNLIKKRNKLDKKTSGSLWYDESKPLRSVLNPNQVLSLNQSGHAGQEKVKSRQMLDELLMQSEQLLRGKMRRPNKR